MEEKQGRSEEGEARVLREEEPEPSRPLERRQRVALWEMRGALQIANLGTIVKISRSGYVHVEWDDHSEGWFSPAKAAATLKPAEGDDALPRHVWIFDVTDAGLLDAERRWMGPRPTPDEPVCAVCREEQTDDNEFGPCRKQG